MTDTDIIKACGEVCTDNRFELIAKYKQLLIDSTNIETAHGEMAVIDSILFRCWQMGWLDKLEEHNRQKAEIERLQDIICVTDKTIKKACDLARAEAIREFAERLKEIMNDSARMDFGGHTYFIIGIQPVDNLVKEMTEGKT